MRASLKTQHQNQGPSVRRPLDALRLRYGVPRHREPQLVLQIRRELRAEQENLGGHAAALLDHVAEMRLERLICDDDGFAERFFVPPR